MKQKQTDESWHNVLSASCRNNNRDVSLFSAQQRTHSSCFWLRPDSTPRFLHISSSECFPCRCCWLMARLPLLKTRPCCGGRLSVITNTIWFVFLFVDVRATSRARFSFLHVRSSQNKRLKFVSEGDFLHSSFEYWDIQTFLVFHNQIFGGFSWQQQLKIVCCLSGIFIIMTVMRLRLRFVATYLFCSKNVTGFILFLVLFHRWWLMRHTASLHNLLYRLRESKLKEDESPRHGNKSLSARVAHDTTQDEDVIMTRWFCDDRYISRQSSH